MDRTEYEQLKQSGELVTDAALQEAETQITPDDRYEEPEDVEQSEDQQEEQEAPEDAPEDAETDDTEEEDELTPQEKTAFQKRLEREQKKIREDMEREFEQKYGKHKEVIESLGGDPDKILAAARENRIIQEAQRMAEANGWTDEETRWYVDQQKQQQELKELRVQMQINRLKDQPDYLGIDRMEKEIMSKIDKSNGALTVEEAFWALGGPKRVEQVKLEAQQREIARRAQQPRTVQRDAPSTAVGEKPLPSNVLKEAQSMGISEAEARRLYQAKPASNIDEWREQRKAK